MPRQNRFWDSLDTIWRTLAWGLFMFGLISLPVIVLIATAAPDESMYFRLIDAAFITSFAGYPFLVAAIVLIPTLALAVGNMRRRRAMAVLGYLQQAFRLNLPLNRYLDAASRSERLPVSRKLFRLQQLMEAGRPLTESLQWVMPELPARSLALIGHAEAMGRVPQTLDRLIDEQLAASRKYYQNRALATWYPPLLLFLAGVLIYLMSVFLGPKFADILKDFHVPMPLPSRWLFFSADWMQPATAVMFCVLLCACGLRAREIFYPTQPSWLFDRIKGFILWNTPLLGGIVYDRALADLCSALADSVESQRTLEQAISHARELRLHPIVRKRLEAWNERLAAGQPIDQAAIAAGFPPLLAGMMNPGGAGLGAALRFLANYYADRTLVRRAVLRGVYLPIVTVCMGVLVATIALGVFLPMQRLTEFLGGGF